MINVIIRKEHWRRKKQWDFGFGFRTRPLNGANGERGVTYTRRTTPRQTDRVPRMLLAPALAISPSVSTWGKVISEKNTGAL
jgi:hypothetical protein